MTPKEVSEKAKHELAALTGFKAPTVVGVARDGKEWRITIEITEKASIPEGFDVLGIYVVRLDPQGELLGYERERMRKRMETQ